MNKKRIKLIGVFLGIGVSIALNCNCMYQVPDPDTLIPNVIILKRELWRAKHNWPIIHPIVLPDPTSLLGGNEEGARSFRDILLKIHGARAALAAGQAANGSVNNNESVLHADNAAKDIGLYDMLAEFCNGITLANGHYANVGLCKCKHDACGSLARAQAGSVLDGYIAFAETAGDVDNFAIDAAHCNFQARSNEETRTFKTKAAMITGLTPANLRAYGVSLHGTGWDANNGQLALYLGLLRLAEIAEHGTIGGQNGQLENCTISEGYTDTIIDAVNDIIADLNDSQTCKPPVLATVFTNLLRKEKKQLSKKI
ncbi:MAG: hypothetical protein LBD81_02500 [Holosporaceae bacterium]|jgi:hypothetical protein|nr:hypothetical protein [Holosporaceae bacterium]